VTRQSDVAPFLFSTSINMEDATVGGKARDRLALRRAIALGIDTETMVKVVYGGQALAANQIVPPGVGGFDPSLPKRSLHDKAAARQLLDRFGFDKRDAEGFRKGPDGKPLTVTFTLRSGAVSREIQTLVKRDMDALGIRMDFHITPFQDVVKEMIAGKYHLGFVGQGGSASGYAELITLWGKSDPSVNPSRFRLAEYDAAFAQFLRSADPAGQIAAARRMSELAQAYMPMLPMIFRIESNFVQPWLQGFSPPVYQPYWKYLDIDLAKRRSMAGKS